MKKFSLLIATFLLVANNLLATPVFHYQDDPNKPVSSGGSILFKHYSADHPDGYGEDLCVHVGHDRNFDCYAFPSGGAEDKDTITKNGLTKKSILATIKRETLEETGGAVNLSDEELEKAPIVYSKKFRKALAAIPNDNLGCMALTNTVKAAIQNPALPHPWKEMDRYVTIPVDVIIKTARAVRKHIDTIGNYDTMDYRKVLANIPADLRPRNTLITNEHNVIELTTRCGEKIPFSVYYFSTIFDQIDYFEQLVKQIRLPKGFLASRYLELNPDLSVLTQGKNNSEQEAALTNHYRQFGRQEGRFFNVPENFESQIYLALNPDLAAVTQGMSQVDADLFAKKHYAERGVQEKRSYGVPASFNPELYIALHQDLEPALVGKTAKERATFSREHYAFFGKGEKRTIVLPPLFDPTVYLALHADVKATTNGQSKRQALESAKIHYAKEGRHQNRSVGGPADFDPSVYLTLHPEIARHVAMMSRQEKNAYALFHYTFHGAKEGRDYKFDPGLYYSLNPDLQALIPKGMPKNEIDEFLLMHYQANLFNKDMRPYKTPFGFNPAMYLALNPDLSSILKKGASQAENDSILSAHYTHVGVKEGRLYEYPRGFNPAVYLVQNPDLQVLVDPNAPKQQNDKALLDHFLKSGIKENRTYVFKPERYLALNQDLQVLFQPTFSQQEKDAALLDHFLNHGIAEGRPYAPPVGFDSRLYLALNPDLDALIKPLDSPQKKQELLITHYLSTGKKQGLFYRYPEGFYPEVYFTLNVDLAVLFQPSDSQRIKNIKLMNHFLDHGQKEGRNYLFNPKGYLAKNPQLAKILSRPGMTQAQKDHALLENYLRYGFRKGLQF